MNIYYPIHEFYLNGKEKSRDFNCSKSISIGLGFGQNRHNYNWRSNLVYNQKNRLRTSRTRVQNFVYQPGLMCNLWEHKTWDYTVWPLSSGPAATTICILDSTQCNVSLSEQKSFFQVDSLTSNVKIGDIYILADLRMQN